MACNYTSAINQPLLSVDNQRHTVIPETPLVQEHTGSVSKRPREHSSADFNVLPTMEVSSEMQKLIVKTCRSIVQLELQNKKLEDKLSALEQHRTNGTFPKDLLIPNKKSLFEDGQATVNEILNKAMKDLLGHRVLETQRKIAENSSRRSSI